MTSWINQDTRIFLSRGYLKEGVSVEERIHEMAQAAGKHIKLEGWAEEFEEQALAGWFSFASPVWSCFGLDRGLPISCNGSFVGDSVEDILRKTSEIGMQTKNQAGTSSYIGALRDKNSPISTGGYADGPMFYLKFIDDVVNRVTQSNVRRGNHAAYIDVSNPAIMDFLKIKTKLESGEEYFPHLNFGVTISNEWMRSMLDGDNDKRNIWLEILRRRNEDGYPYIVWTDTMNERKPDVYKEFNLKIWASNLCTEIALPSSVEETFVCCLSSMNLDKYDEWKDTNAVRNLTFFLDAVIEEYIVKTEGAFGFETAHNFAKRHRAIGVGSLGLHHAFQKRMMSFEGFEALNLDIIMHKQIGEQSLEASRELVRMGFEPVFNTDRRNTTTTAIAPTTSSSFILGQVSPSIEPLTSNYFVKDLAKGKFENRNPYLRQLLSEKGMDNEEVWTSILNAGGSVQHLSALSQHEKDVFKTFGEIPQRSIIIHASARQRHIDQAQSINLMVHPDTPVKDVHELTVEAWQLGLKSLYYQRSTNPLQEFSRSILDCAVCEA